MQTVSNIQLLDLATLLSENTGAVFLAVDREAYFFYHLPVEISRVDDESGHTILAVVFLFNCNMDWQEPGV